MLQCFCEYKIGLSGIAVVTRMVNKVKRRNKLLFVVCLLMIWMMAMAVPSSAAEVKKDGWYYETVEESGREGYRYYIDGNLKVLNWMYNTETGIWYYLDAEGIMTTGWGEGYAEGYYFDRNGIMVTGWHYLLAPSSDIPDSTVQATTNMVEASSPSEEAEYSGWYYFKTGGVMATGWQKIEGDWYYFADEKMQGFCKGQMICGNVNLEGNQYYFDERTGRMQTGFIEDGGSIYYYSPVGMLKKNAWIKSGNHKYYAGADGKLYMSTEGAYVIKQIDGEVYAFDRRGRMLTGKTLFCENEKWSTYEPVKTGEYAMYTFSAAGQGTAGTYTVQAK